jgi:hypothetical protein
MGGAASEGAIMTTTYEHLATAFDAGFGGATTTPDDPRYDEARAVWNDTVGHRPRLIAHCRSTADIVDAVNLTRSSGVPMAVRAGGHSVAGLSSCDDGVVVDLTGLRAVSVDPARRHATVQPGAPPGPTSMQRRRCTGWGAPEDSSRRQAWRD